jgi:phosphoglycolate phosphatase
MAPRLAIVDFDGTLADTWPWFRQVIDDAAVKLGFRRIDDAEAERMRGLSAREIVDALGLPWHRVPALVAYMRKRAANDGDRIPLFPGTAALLRDLSRGGVTVAIVSSNREETIRQVLGEHAAAVSVYECGASLFGKPAKLRKAVKRAGHTTADAIAIGDEVRDIDAAHEAGITSGAVLWGFASGEALRRAEPHHVFDEFDAIRSLLLTR